MLSCTSTVRFLKGVSVFELPKRIFFAAALAFSPAALIAQVASASLEGVVQDATGASVPAAKVQILNVSTGVKTNATTASDGRFVTPSLQPGGPYTVTVEASGFKTEERAGITLEVNQSARLTITLQVGSSSEVVKITADAPQLEASTAEMGTVINNKSIVDLPLNQRNPYSLVFLAPGVNGTVTQQYNSENISVNGGRPGSSDILVDGIPSSPPLVNPIQGFAVFPSVDAVQEFKVQTNSYSAEFGRTGSGIINLIYKSGTNQYHGSAFEFIRNSDLDSNPFFSNLHGTPIGNFKRSQFGGSLGGPIDIPKLYHGHDRTFFFFAYEGLRQGTGTSVTATVPTALQRAGNFSQTLTAAGAPVSIYDPSTTVTTGAASSRQPFPGNIIPSSRINSVAAVLNYYPLPNQTGNTAGQNNYFAAGSSILNSDQIDAKVDENINDKNRFFVRYSRRNLAQPFAALFPAADVVAEGGDSQPQISNSVAVDYTWTQSPTFLLEIRGGVSRTLINFTPVSNGFNPTTLGFPSYIAAGADHLLFPGFAPQNYYTLGDAAQGDYRHGGFQSEFLGATATKVLLSHVIKFGAEGRQLRANDQESGNSTGNFSFTNALTQGPNPNVAAANSGNAIATMLLGVGSGTMTIASKNAATESEYYGFFAQDDWKFSKKLTFNIGLRYGFDMPRTERYNRMETFNPNVASPLAAQIGIPNLVGGLEYVGVGGNSRRQYSPQLNNFDPRFGFSYQFDDNTVLRGGYGIFHGPSYRAAGATIGNYGFSATTTYTGSPNGLTPVLTISNPFPNGLNQPLGSSQGLLTGYGTSFESPLTGDNRVPYTENWDVDVQRQLPRSLLIDVAYVGSHGVHLNGAGENDFNIDQLTPQALSLGTALQQSVPNPFYGFITTGPYAAATVPRSFLVAPFPQYAAVDASFPAGGYTIYHSVQVKVEKRFSQGLNVLLAFTGQKLIDDYSILSNVGNNAGGIQNIYNPAGEKSLSSNDISKRLVISGNYSLPFGRGQMFGKNWNRFTDTVLGGWQVNGIATAQTGFPLAVTTQNTSNSGSNVLRPNNNGASAAFTGPVSLRLNNYLNAAVFSQPAPFTFGNTGRTLPDVRAPGLENIDFSLFKNFQIKERLSAQLRAEAFNLLNQVVFGSPNTVLSSGQFGVISSQSNSPRTIQFGLKLLF
jgi:Carboxypeptidase regulatory-like domain/TonB dependent receptor